MTYFYVSIVVAVTLLYWFPLRRWFGQWGTTGDELTRIMAGDAFIARPTHSATYAITVNAAPAEIWPWLVQIGHQRGGLYSYDWLDRLFGFLDRSSANQILPEFQNLALGDKIFLGPREVLTVTGLEPARSLVLSYQSRGIEWVWQFGLYPQDENCTRLVTREPIGPRGGAALFAISKVSNEPTILTGGVCGRAGSSAGTLSYYFGLFMYLGVHICTGASL
jgi:hypothetical protein